MREILPAKALGISISELFAATDEIEEVNSHDKTVMEKVSLIESLNNDEKNIFTVCSMHLLVREIKRCSFKCVARCKIIKPRLWSLFERFDGIRYIHEKELIHASAPIQI